MIAVCMVSVLPFLLICQYVHPVNDDYVYALRNSSMDAVHGIVTTYLNWSGRYFATFLSCLNPLVFRDSAGYMEKVYSVVVIFLFVLFIYVMVRSLFHRTLSNLQQVSLCSFLTIIFLIQSPRISEFFYWFSCYVAYTVPCMLSMLLISFIRRKTIASVLFQSLLIVCIIGSNEVIAVLLTCTVLFWASENYRQRRGQCVVLITVAFLSMLVVAFSPGNFQRMSGQLSSHPYLWSFVVSLFQTFSWFVIWLPVLMLATVFYVPMFGLKIARKRNFDCSMKKYLLFVLVTIFLAHIPPTLGLSSVMIGRTADDLYLFFIFFYFFGVQIVLSRYADGVAGWYRQHLSRVATSCLFFVFLFLCVFQIDTPVATAYVDMLSGKAADYDGVIEQRYAIMRRQLKSQGDKPHAVLRLPSLALVPKTIYVNDLINDTSDVFNQAYQEYYGLKCGVAVDNPDHIYLSNYESLFLMGKHLRK